MANSKAHHNRFLTTIRDVLQSNSLADNIDYICGSLVLFEKHYASKHKDAFRKMVNEAMAAYGPGTSFESDDRMIPIYVFLGKYSRSSSVAEIFEKMNSVGTYRNSALFYLEWSNSYREAGNTAKAEAILQEGQRRRVLSSRPLDHSQRMDSRHVPVPHASKCSSSLTPGTSRLTSRILLPGPATTKMNQPNSRTNQRGVECSRSVEVSRPQSPMQSTDLNPPESVASNDLPSPIRVLPDTVVAEKEDAENKKPLEVQSDDIILPRRRTAGVLVPATGFQLDDYDFFKKEEEEEERKLAEEEKEKANLQNIRNNQMASTIESTVLPSATNDFVLPSTTLGQPLVPQSESRVDDDFVDGQQALLRLEQHSSEDDCEVENNRRLTGFEKMLQQRRLTKTRYSLAKPPMIPQRQAEFDLGNAFARMEINSKTPSTP